MSNQIKAAIRPDGVVVAVASEDGTRPAVEGAAWADLADKTLPEIPAEVSALLASGRFPYCFKVMNRAVVARTLAEINEDPGA